MKLELNTNPKKGPRTTFTAFGEGENVKGSEMGKSCREKWRENDKNGPKTLPIYKARARS